MAADIELASRQAGTSTTIASEQRVAAQRPHLPMLVPLGHFPNSDALLPTGEVTKFKIPEPCRPPGEAGGYGEPSWENMEPDPNRSKPCVPLSERTAEDVPYTMYAQRWRVGRGRTSAQPRRDDASNESTANTKKGGARMDSDLLSCEVVFQMQASSRASHFCKSHCLNG
jgi:hypothetical protein